MWVLCRSWSRRSSCRLSPHSSATSSHHNNFSFRRRFSTGFCSTFSKLPSSSSDELPLRFLPLRQLWRLTRSLFGVRLEYSTRSAGGGSTQTFFSLAIILLDQVSVSLGLIAYWACFIEFSSYHRLALERYSICVYRQYSRGQFLQARLEP